MSCYHPLTAYQGPIVNDSGKRPLIFLKGDIDTTQVVPDGHRLLKVPCGQCIGCRMDYSKQWAIRCALEAKQWTHNWFVTLTYNDQFVPLNEHCICDENTGEVIDSEYVMTLLPDDLKNFIKRLRKYFKQHYDFDGIRFYACGEYGPKNMRPHFHLILFNCPLPEGDLTVHHVANGYTYYESKLIAKAWERRMNIDGESVRVSLGYVQVTDFSYEAASYVARYMLKKHKGKDADYYDRRGIYPEFTRCSRKPGIAYQYYKDNADTIYEFDQLPIIGGKHQVIKVHPPSYFDRLFDVDNPEEMSKIKERRQDKAVRSMANQLAQTDLSESEYLATKEAAFRERLKKLQRSL